MKNLIIIALAGIILSSCNSKPEISQWRGPDRNGIYPETGLLQEWPENGPELLWKYEGLGQGYASAAVLSDRVYTIGTLDSISYVFRFDLQGNLTWKKPLGPEWMKNFPGINSSPLIYGDRGYLLGGLGVLYCFDTETGEKVWTKDLFTDFDGVNNKYGITENMVIDGDMIFCTPGGKDANVIALNRLTGDLIWKNPGNGGISTYASPTLFSIKENNFLVTITDSTILSIETKTGKLAWKYNLGKVTDTHGNVPVYKDGKITVMGCYYSGLMQLEVTNDGFGVKEVWRNKNANAGFGDIVVLDGKIYGPNNQKKMLYALDFNTGKKVDSLKLDMFGSLVSADGKLYNYTYKGTFSLIDVNNGMKEVGQFKVDGKEHCSQQVIKDGRMYVRFQNDLYVYDIKDKV